MDKAYEEFVIDISEVRCDQKDARDYADVLNGISWDCQERHGFSVGYRNKVIVDLTVAAYRLALDPETVLDKMVERDVINPAADDEDTYNRLRTVLCYDESFCWDWMIDPDDYLELGRNCHKEKLLVRFTVEGTPEE